MTLCSFPGSLLVLTSVVRVCWQEDEAAVTATPVYHPFFAAPENQGRELKRFPMSYEAGAWQFPMNALERASAGNSRLLMLCNPFNPIGRTLTQTELEAIVDISVQNDLCYLLRRNPLRPCAGWQAAYSNRFYQRSCRGKNNHPDGTE